jgi:hypothetical protein
MNRKTTFHGRLPRMSQPWCLLALLLLAVGVAGCSSRKKQAEFEKGYLAGQERARKAQEEKQTTVLFRGQVKQPLVPWEEGLKLSQALNLAGYTGLTNPRNIMLIRKGQVFQIAPQKLLSGAVDPELEPGDVVELMR